MKDLASATSSHPAEFRADSYLMTNCLEFLKPLYFGRETGLNFGGHGAVCSPIDSGDSESTNSISREKIFFRGSSVWSRVLEW
jgi:hypothetical protein